MFSDSFSGTLDSHWNAPTFAPVSGVLKNTPTMIGGELLTNGNMETGSPPTGWANSGGTPTADASCHSGTQALKFVTTSNNDFVLNGFASVVGHWYLVKGWVKCSAGYYRVVSYNKSPTWAVLDYGVVGTSATYVPFWFITKATLTTTYVGFEECGAASTIYLDDVSVIELNYNSTFATVKMDNPGIFNIKAVPSSVGGNVVGLYLCGDAAKANQITIETVSYGVNGTQFKVAAKKNINGTVTQLVSSPVTIVAGAELRVLGDGAGGLIVYYNGVQVINNTTFISDAAIISNPYFGVMIANTNESIGSFFIQTNKYPSRVFAYGDSKWTSANPDVLQLLLASNKYVELPLRVAIPGQSIQAAQTNIDTQLAAIAATPAPAWILFDLGVDSDTLNAAQREAALLYIFDAFHTKWPNAIVLVAHLWSSGHPNYRGTELDYAIANRLTFCRAGIDENTVLEGGEGGASRTTDGTHPNVLGMAYEEAAYLPLLV
jgi:hypothetical protein